MKIELPTTSYFCRFLKLSVVDDWMIAGVWCNWLADLAGLLAYWLPNFAWILGFRVWRGWLGWLIDIGCIWFGSGG